MYGATLALAAIVERQQHLHPGCQGDDPPCRVCAREVQASFYGWLEAQRIGLAARIRDAEENDSGW